MADWLILAALVVIIYQLGALHAVIQRQSAIIHTESNLNREARTQLLREIVAQVQSRLEVARPADPNGWWARTFGGEGADDPSTR